MGVIITAIVAVGIAYAIYIDAQKRGLKAAAWFGASLVVWFVPGIIYYLAVRKKHPFVEDATVTKTIPGFRSKGSGNVVLACLLYAGYIYIVFTAGFGANMDQPVNQASKSQPSTKAPVSSIDKIAVSADSYAKGLEAYNNQNYLEAVTYLQRVDESYENYADAQSKLNECKKPLADQLVSDAKRCLKEQDYDGALTQLKAAISYNPDSEAKSMIPEVEKQKQAYLEKQKQAEIKSYKDSCQSIAYKVLNKNPDGHKGEKVKLTGEIMQIQESSGKTFMLLSVTNKGYGYWTDNVAVTYYGNIDAYKDDVITIYGDVTGAFSYTSTAGWDITVPGVLARYVD